MNLKPAILQTNRDENGDITGYRYLCPTCNAELTFDKSWFVCGNCGQAISWVGIKTVVADKGGT